MSSDTSSVSEHQGRITEAQLRSRNFQPRVSTPDTEITDHPEQPDITLFCDECGSFILLRLLQEHRKYHAALALLQYRDLGDRPQSAALLLKRRQAVLARMNRRAAKEGKPPAMSATQRVNDAYELLKAYLDGTYEELLQSREAVHPDCRGLALTCSAPCARAVGICSHDNRRWKPGMEDARVFQDYFGNDRDKCFFGVYDGHGGRFAADVAANDLHHFLLGAMAEFDPATACTCALNHAQRNDLAGYRLERPRLVVRKDSLRHILHEDSHNLIQQILHTCQEKVSALDPRRSPGRPAQSRGEGKAAKSVANRREGDPFAEKMEQAFRTAYQMVDCVLSYGIDEHSRVRWSGCSALTCVLKSTAESDDEEEEEEYEDKREVDENGQTEVDGKPKAKEFGVLYVANAGNSQAVLCQDGTAVRLSRKHTLQSSQERARILRAGSSVKAGGAHGGRVNGVLDTTRGLGNHGDPLLKAAVSVEPHTLSVTLDGRSEFLILASHGLWAVLSEQEAVSLVRQLLPGQEVSPPCPPLLDDDPLRDLRGLGTLDLRPSLGSDEDRERAGDSRAGPESLADGSALGPNAGSDRAGRAVASERKSRDGGEETAAPNRNPSAKSAHLSSGLVDDATAHPKSASAPPALAREPAPSSVTPRGEAAGRSSGLSSFVADPPTGEGDSDSDQTEFESLLSALMENDDGNEADVETLTELHTIYAQSRLRDLELPGRQTRNEAYRGLAQRMSERLVQSALLAGSRDNITVMVVLLPGCKAE